MVFKLANERIDKKTWTACKDWLLGHGSNISLSIGSKLPLQESVMRRLLGLQLKESETVHQKHDSKKNVQKSTKT